MSASTPTPRPAGANTVRVPRPARPSRWSYRLTVAVVVLLATLLAGSPAEAGGVPQPNGGNPPPGTDGLLTILDWGFWIVSLIGVGGLLGVAAFMMVRHNRGQAGESMGSLGWVLGGCVLATAAGPIGNVLF